MEAVELRELIDRRECGMNCTTLWGFIHMEWMDVNPLAFVFVFISKRQGASPPVLTHRTACAVTLKQSNSVHDTAGNLSAHAERN